MSRLIMWGLGFWLLLMVIATANAGIREKLYSPRISELHAHQLSTVIFSLVIFLVTFIMYFLGQFNESASAYIILGFTWLILTLSFEFVAGYYLFGNTWEKLLANYNLRRGRLWILILISVLTAPWIISQLINQAR